MHPPRPPCPGSTTQVKGPNAVAFLAQALANDARLLADGEAQYSYMLDAHGRAIDDLCVTTLRPVRTCILCV